MRSSDDPPPAARAGPQAPAVRPFARPGFAPRAEGVRLVHLNQSRASLEVLGHCYHPPTPLPGSLGANNQEKHRMTIQVNYRIMILYFACIAMLNAQALPATANGGKQMGAELQTYSTPSDFQVTSSDGIHPVEINENIKYINEKSLFFDASLGVHADPGGSISNGVRFYSFRLQPKEKLFVQLTAEDSNRVGMEFLMPAKTDPMIKEFTRFKYMPKALRSSRMEIKNITEQPYTLVLMTYGQVNHWYKIEIKRSMQ